MSGFILNKKVATAWKNNKVPFSLAIAGSLLILLGTISFLQPTRPQEPSIVIESLNQESQLEKQGKMIKVDVSGAVLKPGVYEFSPDNDPRLQDALLAAGGLTVSANRDYVSQVLNLAAPLIDGQKIYIPPKEEEFKAGSVASWQATQAKDSSRPINLNTASQSQLEGLRGIGPARAASIVQNRPYARIDELVEKKIIPKNVFEEIKGQISTY